ncbi:MAG TPA: BON domain-containing protein [Trebonia sp.]|jgi:hypothetical protein
MKENTYVAGQVERALHGDPRTHELGITVDIEGEDVVLRGQVASEERRQFAAQVAREVAGEQGPGLRVRNETSVTEVLPPDEVPEILLPPRDTAPAREVQPPHEASS